MIGPDHILIVSKNPFVLLVVQDKQAEETVATAVVVDGAFLFFLCLVCFVFGLFCIWFVFGLFVLVCLFWFVFSETYFYIFFYIFFKCFFL